MRCPAAGDGGRLCKVLKALQRIWVFLLNGGKWEGWEEKIRADLYWENITVDDSVENR